MANHTPVGIPQLPAPAINLFCHLRAMGSDGFDSGMTFAWGKATPLWSGVSFWIHFLQGEFTAEGSGRKK